MNHSLSYILPVKNAQSGLTSQVDRLLEMLSELTPWFELLIVDEGSNDDTTEIAYELAQRYPQVNVVCAVDSESDSMLETMGQLSGEVVFLADRLAEPEAHELRTLWNMRNDKQLVMARLPRGPQNVSTDLITRLMSWGDALRDAGDDAPARTVRMLRRSAMMQMSGQHRPEVEMAY